MKHTHKTYFLYVAVNFPEGMYIYKYEEPGCGISISLISQFDFDFEVDDMHVTCIHVIIHVAIKFHVGIF